MIKLITIDLDGTLLDDKKNISEENIKAIKYAKEKGANVVISTGRPINGIKGYLKSLDLLDDGYLILYNGAMIYSLKDKKVISTTLIDGKIIKRLYEESKKLGVYIHAFRDNEELILEEYNIYSHKEVTLNKITFKFYDFSKIKDDDLFLKCLLVEGKEKLNYAEKQVSKDITNNYTMMRSAPIFLEFLNKNTDKGIALTKLAKYLNVDMKDTMAIGDAGNDISMIAKSGFGVAMKNSFEEVFQYADYITDSNENSGVAKAIYKAFDK